MTDAVGMAALVALAFLAFFGVLASDAAGQTVSGGWNGRSTAPSISADGSYVALVSAASDMVAGDSNGADDIFVYDELGGATGRVSVASSGAQANGASSQPAISADGRYVAFYSAASNLVSGDTNAVGDIFVHDRLAAATTRVSVDSAGAQANGASSQPAISANGRYVAFRSAASNLVSGDTNTRSDIFVYDRTTAATKRISVDSAGTQTNGSSHEPSLSSDGSVVAFHSTASNLVSGDTNGVVDVFVRSGTTTTRVSLTSAGAQASGLSTSPSISANGSRVAFESTAALASGDKNSGSDIYVRDRSANTTTWATHWAATTGWVKGGTSSSPSISADGRYVAMALDSDVQIDDLNGVRDVYEYDLATGAWAHISRDDVHGAGNQASDSPSLSADGTYTAFASLATNFYVDTNGLQDTFVHEWEGLPTTASQSATATNDAPQQTPVPRACSLAKPDISTDQPAPQPSPDDSTDPQIPNAGPLEDLLRLRCKIRVIPRPPICALIECFPQPDPPDDFDRVKRCNDKCERDAEDAALAESRRVYQASYWECMEHKKDPVVCDADAKTQAAKAYGEKYKEVWRRCMEDCGVDPDAHRTSFPKYEEKFGTHYWMWDPIYESAHQYKKDAQDVADGRYTRGVEFCVRPRDLSFLYWVPNRGPGERRAIGDPLNKPKAEGAIVFVHTQGGRRIGTFFPPDEGKAYWDAQCAR
jgi:Tol biopolymer transport system component